jgi:hypothetical protein
MGYGLSKTSAMLLTFLLSASVHELVMVIVTQKFRCDIHYLTAGNLIIVRMLM